MVDAVLPLPHRAPGGLVLVTRITDPGDRASVSPAGFHEARFGSRMLEVLFFWTNAVPALTGLGNPAQLEAARVGAHFVEVLRAHP